jgi:hypothetical protein
LRQNGCLSVLSSIEEPEKSRVGGDDRHVEVWDSAMLWCNRQLFYRQISVWSLRTFSRSCRKTSRWYAELTDWPARNNSL